MKKKQLVLLDMQISKEPLYLEFKDNVHISNTDQIICDITIEQALKMLEANYGSYFEENILIPSDVKSFLEGIIKERKGKE